jgi:hypothetical protein
LRGGELCFLGKDAVHRWQIDVDFHRRRDAATGGQRILAESVATAVRWVANSVAAVCAANRS